METLPLYNCCCCGESKFGWEMYKVIPLTMCLECLERQPKTTLKMYDWSRDGWAEVSEIIVPENPDHRLGSNIVDRG